jgi:hypothetical protein
VALFNNAGSTDLVVDVFGWCPLGAFTRPIPARHVPDVPSCERLKSRANLDEAHAPAPSPSKKPASSNATACASATPPADPARQTTSSTCSPGSSTTSSDATQRPRRPRHLDPTGTPLPGPLTIHLRKRPPSPTKCSEPCQIRPPTRTPHAPLPQTLKPSQHTTKLDRAGQATSHTTRPFPEPANRYEPDARASPKPTGAKRRETFLACRCRATGSAFMCPEQGR